MSYAIRVEEVSFKYDSKQVIYDLSFGVEEGEALGIIGKNGSGKTTLLRLIAGWLHPQRGGIEVFGRKIREMSDNERSRTLALLSQSVEFSFETSVFEMILLGRAPYIGRFQEPRPVDIEVVKWAMELTDTWELRKIPVSQLSAGERQRAMISRAFAQQTPILLLDEPTSNLDIAHQRMVMDNISWLRKERNITVMLVSHDVNLTSRYSDRMLMMTEGRKVALGPGLEVLTGSNLRATYGVDLVIEERGGRKVVLEWENGGKLVPWE
ncbi:MAG: ABC transporter ATP-binding protein [Candidatus Glassbacteria bacterium]